LGLHKEEELVCSQVTTISFYISVTDIALCCCGKTQWFLKKSSLVSPTMRNGCASKQFSCNICSFRNTKARCVPVHNFHIFTFNLIGDAERIFRLLGMCW